jgi:hypothetical protein
MNIDWGIMRPVDIGARFQEGYDRQQQNALRQREVAFRDEERERSTELRNALTGAINPQTGAIDYGVARRAYIGAGDLQGAIGVDTASAAAASRQRELAQQNIVRGARIVRQMNPTDDASWQRTLAAARQAGVDLTDVPTTFDPNYMQMLLAAAAAASEPSEGFTLDEGAVRYDQNGNVVARGNQPRPRYFPVPAGGRLELDPSYSGPVAEAAPASSAPAVGAVEEGYRFRGGDPANPASWEPVQGGPPRQGAATFPQDTRPRGVW